MKALLQAARFKFKQLLRINPKVINCTEQLKKARLSVCRNCPLFVLGQAKYVGGTVWLCNNAVTFTGAEESKPTPELITVTIDGLRKGLELLPKSTNPRGCGCTLNALDTNLPEKTTIVGDETCPRNAWDEVEFSRFQITNTLHQVVDKAWFRSEYQELITKYGFLQVIQAFKYTLKLEPCTSNNKHIPLK